MVAPVTLDAEGAIQIMQSNDYDVLPIVNDGQLEGMWCAPELNDTTSSPSIHSEPQICHLNWKIDTLFNKINRNNPYLIIVDKKQTSTQYGVVTWHDATDAII